MKYAGVDYNSNIIDVVDGLTELITNFISSDS